MSLYGSWTMWQNGRLLGEVDVNDVDQPVLRGPWLPTEAFESVAPLFAAELAAVDRGLETPEDIAIFEGAWAAIMAAGVTFHHPDGQLAAEFLLHIEEGQGRFRFNDEPFDTPPLPDKA